MTRRDFIAASAAAAAARGQILQPIISGGMLMPPASGLLARYEASKVGLSDGSLVATWPDSSGNGRDATQSTTAQKPTYVASGIGGFPCVSFNGTGSAGTRSMIIPSGVSVNRRAWGIYAVVAQNQTTAQQVIASLAGSGSNFQMTTSGPAISNFPSLYYSDGTFTASSAQRVYAGINFRGASVANPALAIYDHERTFTATGSVSSVTLNGGFIGSYTSGGALGASAAILELLIYDHALSAGDLSQLKAYFQQVYGIRASYNKQISFTGDSICNGVGATAGLNLPNRILQLNPGCIGWNEGYTGRKASQLATDVVTLVNPLYSAGFTRNIIVAGGGANDAVAGDSNATVYASIVALCQALKSAGWTVVYKNIIPRGGVDAAGINALVASGLVATGYCDAVADVGGAAWGSPGNATYYADTVHPNNAGYAMMASIVNAAIQPFL